jgi:hypothetical protein
MKRVLSIAVGVGIVLVVASQFVRPSLPNPPVTADLEAPAPVNAVLRSSCYDCNSNEAGAERARVPVRIPRLAAGQRTERTPPS